MNGVAVLSAKIPARVNKIPNSPAIRHLESSTEISGNLPSLSGVRKVGILLNKSAQADAVGHGRPVEGIPVIHDGEDVKNSLFITITPLIPLVFLWPQGGYKISSLTAHLGLLAVVVVRGLHARALLASAAQSMGRGLGWMRVARLVGVPPHRHTNTWQCP